MQGEWDIEMADEDGHNLVSGDDPTATQGEVTGIQDILSGT